MRISGVELLKAQRIRAAFLSMVLDDPPDWDAPCPANASSHGAADWRRLAGIRRPTCHNTGQHDLVLLAWESGRSSVCYVADSGIAKRAANQYNADGKAAGRRTIVVDR